MISFLYRIGCYLALSCGLYYLWSRAYRWIWERRIKGEVEVAPTLGRLLTRMSEFYWTPDGPQQLWDAIGYPRSLETGGDCDEFAAWCCSAGRDGVIDTGGVRWVPVGILSVPWRGGGHNVALFVEEWLAGHVRAGIRGSGLPALAHVSNTGWHPGFNNIRDVAFDVARRAGEVPMAFSLVSPDLKTRISYQWIGGEG